MRFSRTFGLCLVAVSSAFAQPVRFDGERVVRVMPEPERLQDVLALTDDVWSHHINADHGVDIRLGPDAYDALVEMGIEHEVLIENVQDLVALEREQIDASRMQRDVTWFETYRTYTEIKNRVASLSLQYADLATYDVIGNSLQGREISVVRITGPGDSSTRPAIYIQGCQHAREWVSPMTVTFIAEHLLERYGSDPRVTQALDNVVFHIVPIVNPDGYEYSWNNNRLWRKNRRGGYGVDLNRNWSYDWGGDGSSGNTSDETYRGTAPFSEPESQVASAYIQTIPNRIAAIDFHSYSQLVLRPWGTTFADPPDEAVLRELGDLMADEIFATFGMFYESIPSIELYAAAGTAGDWFYGVDNLLGYTIELRDTGNFGFLLPASQIIPTAEENFNATLGMAEYVGLPLSIRHEVPVSVPSDTPTTISVDLIERAASIFPGSERLYTSTDGTNFTSTTMTGIGGDTYEGDLPPAPCGSEISYYFAVNTSSGLVTFPADAPTSVLVTDVLDIDIAFEDDVESDLGWSLADPGDDASTGRWERADPSPTDAQPANDHSESGTLCFITDGRSGSGIGTWDIDGGETTLTSPAIDATGGDAWISYWRWYSNDQGASPNADSMPVEISNGGPWVLLEEVTENANAWVHREFRVADHVEPTTTVRIRFRASDLGDGSIVEAGVDDVQLTLRGCDDVCGDYNGDTIRDIFDVLDYLADFEAQDPGADFNGDTIYDIFDVLDFLGAFSDC